MKKALFVLLQYLTPQHPLSRLIGRVANCRIAVVKSLFIKTFIRHFKVNMEEALQSDPQSYACFNDFFCRALKADARPLATSDNALVSPADGTVSQAGSIDQGRIFQAKGRYYSSAELLGCNVWAKEFDQGHFTTIYLSPRDYHRLHMPIDGELVSMRHIPGDLFSVNPTTTDGVSRLFARNERLVCIFETALGPMAMVLVGAMIVASIETVWAGPVAPVGKNMTTFHYRAQDPIRLKKGEEMGRFKLGSTVILLLPRDTLSWTEECQANAEIKMGERIAEILQ